MEENFKRTEDTNRDCQYPNTIGGSASYCSSCFTAPKEGPVNFCSIHKSGEIPESKSTISQGFHIPVNPGSRKPMKARSSLAPLQPLSIKRRYLEDWTGAGSDDIGDSTYCTTHRGKRNARKLLERDKFSFSDKECSRVTELIYLGSDVAAKNREILRQNGITHVLNCVGFASLEYFKTELVYRTLWLEDRPSEDITSILYDVFDYFEEVREQGGRVFVHCFKGISRSTSLVIAYIMWSKGQSFTDAFKYVKAARSITNPNIGFAGQLSEYEKRMHATLFSPESLLRMYRVAPYSSYAPLHLVPKSVDHPGPDVLDSRGAFIVQIPSTIYVWIGKSCSPFMKRMAEIAALQLVRYERAQGSIVVKSEGQEEDELLDTLSKAPLLLDLLDYHDISETETPGSNLQGSCLGKSHVVPASRDRASVEEKRVESYTLDFKIFRRAIERGVMPPFSFPGAKTEIHLPAREIGWGISPPKFVSGSVKDLDTFNKTTIDIFSSELDAPNDDKAGHMETELLSPGPSKS